MQLLKQVLRRKRHREQRREGVKDSLRKPKHPQRMDDQGLRKIIYQCACETGFDTN